ncbi:MAG: spermidine synthase family protein [Planctomycetota bacterium]
MRWRITAGDRLLLAVALVSAAVLGFEISLMRMLLVASWHHFAFLVISVALLGFGASGTALLLGRSWALRQGERLLFGLVLGAAAAMPLAAAVAQHVPIEAAIAPAVVWRQLAWWVLYWAVLTVPFFLGATAVGLALMLAPARTGAVYGANLIGSAAGALLAPIAMAGLPPELLPACMGLVAFGGAAVMLIGVRRIAVQAACMVLVIGWLWLDRPHVRVDPFKYGAQIRRLLDQGSVYRNGLRYGPRATVAAYSGHSLHDLPFVTGGHAPPPISVLLADGHLAGSVLNVSSPQEADVMVSTLTAFPYGLIPRQRRVALLGETGGANVWLAIRRHAQSVHVVQPDANIVALHRLSLTGLGGEVLDRPEVSLHIAEPRHFIEHGDAEFDLIQLVALERSVAGSGGAGGLGQDYLATVEGVSACLDRLAPDGVLAVTRGIQTPPRDNVRILATLVEALRRRGVGNPQDHVVIVRDFLAVCTIVRASPWTPGDLVRAEALCRIQQLTPVWLEGVGRSRLNQPDALEPAPDGIGDLYHFAARRLFSETADDFLDEWAFDVRPPTDNRPFFSDFCKLSSLGAMRRAYGDLWLARTEVAFLFVLAAIVIVGAAGALATIAPLPLLPATPMSGRGATAIYFGCLGLGYLLLEMIWLSRLTFLIGDPVQAAAVTICGFLLFSGLGSLTTQRIRPDANRRRILRRAVGVILVLGLVETAALPFLAPAAGALPMAGRWAVALAAIAPLAFAMGFPMPMGLHRLQGSGLVPWAWGTNGFASVLAAPLALALAMTWGYHVVAGLSLVAYALAGLVLGSLPGTQSINT